MVSAREVYTSMSLKDYVPGVYEFNFLGYRKFITLIHSHELKG